MSKINFRFLVSKLFLSGVIVGILISAMAAILVINKYYSVQDKSKLTGVVIDEWVPPVNTTGTVQNSGNYCGQMYSDVLFDNDPNNSLIRCHSNYLYSSGTRVAVNSVNSGDFCQGGGCYLREEPTIN